MVSWTDVKYFLDWFSYVHVIILVEQLGRKNP